jgi:MoaA/NifB/PqqE/SkfB family radical SAM enzyme
MCPTGTGVSIREKGFISDDTFRNIINSIKGREIGIRFIRWGEPTLHQKLIEYIKEIKNEGHLCHINTNGMLLNDRLIYELINSGLDSIKFSFQGVDEKSYNEMRQGGGFNKLIETIKVML